MKTEDFDDAIRRKLESIDYSFDETDINRIHQHIQKSNSGDFLWKRFGSFFVFSIGAFLLGGLLFWNYKQLSRQEILESNIANLQESIVQLKKSLALKDSVLVDNYSSFSDFKNKSEESKNNLDRNSKEKIHSADIVSLSNFSVKKRRKYSSNYITTIPLSDESDRLVLFKDLQKNNESVIIKPEGNSLLNSTAKINSSDEKLYHNVSINDKENNISGKLNSEINSSVINNDKLASIYNPGDVQKKILLSDSTLNEEKKGKDSVSSVAEIKKKQIIKKTISLRNIVFQTGFGFEKANKQEGVSILGEIFVSKRFSINTGIKLMSLANDKFKDADDYYTRTSNHLYDDYPINTYDVSTAYDIDIRYNLVQLPVAISYYQPLKKNYSILFSGGTDCDLYNKSHLHYDHGYPGARSRIDTRSSSVFFNNMNISCGIQKQWDHFVIQVSPFVSPQLKQVSYKKDSVYGGFRLRAFYRF